MNGEDSPDEWAGCSSRGEEGFDMRVSPDVKIEMGVDDSNFLLLNQLVNYLHTSINV